MNIYLGVFPYKGMGMCPYKGMGAKSVESQS